MREAKVSRPKYPNDAPRGTPHRENVTMTVPVDFWVATATVAPVIALSATVAIGDFTKESIRLRKSLIPETSSWKLASKRGAFSYSMSYVNIIWQSLVLLKALLSILSAGSELSIPPIVIAYTEAISIFLIFFSVVENSLMRAAILGAPEDQLKKPVNSQVGDVSVNNELLEHGNSQQDNDDEEAAL
jgi:hypothetical protein